MMKKKDLILISVILLIIAVSFLVSHIYKKDGDYVLVRVDGQKTARYELSVDGEYELNGGTNILRIEGGKAYLIYADCPDHLCMNQGTIDQNGETITCLPNRLTVTVYSEDNADVELVS